MTALPCNTCPVRDHAGHPIAAVAVTYPASEANADALAVHVRRAAARVSTRIRGTPA